MEVEEVKIKRPHDSYMTELLSKDSTLIRDRGSGLYYCRMARKMPDLIGTRRIGRDSWVLFRKRPFRRDFMGEKYSWFV